MNERTGITPELDLDNDIAIEPERYEFFEGPAYHFDLDRRGFLKAMGGGILVAVPDRSRCRRRGGAAARRWASPRRGFRRSVRAPGPRRLAAHRRGRPDLRLYGQGGGGPEHPDVLEPGRRRGAAHLDRIDPDGHGRYATDPLRHGHVRQHDDSENVATTPARGGRRPRAAPRPRRRNLEGRSLRADRPPMGPSFVPKTKETIPYGKLTQGKKLTKTVSSQAPTTPADRWTVAGHSVAKVDGRVVRHRQAPVRLGRPAPRHVAWQGAAPAVVRREADRARHQRGQGHAGRHCRPRRGLRGRRRAQRVPGVSCTGRTRGRMEARTGRSPAKTSSRS